MVKRLPGPQDSEPAQPGPRDSTKTSRWGHGAVMAGVSAGPVQISLRPGGRPLHFRQVCGNNHASAGLETDSESEPLVTVGVRGTGRRDGARGRRGRGARPHWGAVRTGFLAAPVQVHRFRGGEGVLPRRPDPTVRGAGQGPRMAPSAAGSAGGPVRAAASRGGPGGIRVLPLADLESSAKGRGGGEPSDSEGAGERWSEQASERVVTKRESAGSDTEGQ